MDNKSRSSSYRAKTDAADLPDRTAEMMFSALSAKNNRCAVYKNCSGVSAALAGRIDLDLLVQEAGLAGMRAVLTDECGIRALPHPLYDNAIPEREDWFLPLDGARMLHLDLAHAVMAGPKFHKRYRVLELAELELEPAGSTGLLRVTPAEEARIALLRSAFQFGPVPLTVWLPAAGELARVIGAVFPQGTGEHAFSIGLGNHSIPFPVRQEGGQFLLDARAMRTIRKAIRQHCGVGPLAAARDWSIHAVRRTTFAIMRRMTLHSPGRAVGKRRFLEGRVVALVGPDGVGKSTQTARLAAAFGHKFRCTSVYLGSNDGSWMKLRGKLGLAGSASSDNSRASKSKSKSKSPGAIPPKGERGVFHSLGSAIWRFVVAGNRLLSIRRAMRLAASGALVITDRWPQNIEPGILDGPSEPPAPRHRLARMIWRAEKRLYRAMDGYAADFTVHLDCDFATSHTRKPGDIEQVDFERRIALMETMRGRDAGIAVVDARQDMDTVTEQLFAAIWQQLRRAG